MASAQLRLVTAKQAISMGAQPVTFAVVRDGAPFDAVNLSLRDGFLEILGGVGGIQTWV